MNKAFISFGEFLSKPYSVIFIAIIVTVVVLPTIFYNVGSDYRIVPYFDHDEGYGRDLAWYYYSGQRLETFQYSLDYGIEYYLIVDLIARPLSLFFPMTPGLLLLIMRFFHFTFGALALVFLWRFCHRHFPYLFVPTLVCLSLLLSGSFVWWLDHVKPEPFLLMLVVLSLGYTLDLIEKPSWKNIILAVSFAAAAFMIKLIGLFILPVILLSFYLFPLVNKDISVKRAIFKILKDLGILFSAVLLFAIAVLFIIIPIGSKIYLSMKIKGFDLEKFASSFSPPKGFLLITNIFVVVVLVSCILFIFWLYKKNKNSLFYKKLSIFPIFIAAAIVFGYRWSFNLFNWAITYARWLQQQHSAPLNLFKSTGLNQSINLLSGNIKGWFLVIIQNDSLGVFGLILFALYLVLEFIFKAWKIDAERARFFKRILLGSYCSFFLLFLFFFQSRHASHHLLTIQIILLLLGFEGLRLLFIRIKDKTKARSVLAAAFSIFIIFGFWQYGAVMLKARFHKLTQKDDKAYEVADWLSKNYDAGTKIVADAPWCVYVPLRFKNVIFVKPRLFLNSSFDSDPELLSEIIRKEKPKIIIYNQCVQSGDTSPDISKFLKGVRLKKVKEFKQGLSQGYRNREDHFIIYELI